jgi:hypothetical protein
VVHGCEPQKRWKCLHAIPQNFGSILVGKWVSGIPCTQLEKYRRRGIKPEELSFFLVYDGD